MLSWLPDNISSFGNGVDQLFRLIYSITLAIFILVNIIYVWFIIRYRRRRKTDTAYHYHGNNALEFVWTALPFGLFLFLALYSDAIWTDIKYPSHEPKPDFTVEVMAQRYMWHFRYPGSDGIFGHREERYISAVNPFGIDPNDPNGKDDYVVVNQLHLPINKNIRLRLSAMDVIHSFFVPSMRVKQDGIPGEWVDIWFNGRKAGVYEIACAELCGSGHYLMRGVLTFQSQTDFDHWIDDQYHSVEAASRAAVTQAAPVPRTGASSTTTSGL